MATDLPYKMPNSQNLWLCPTLLLQKPERSSRGTAMIDCCLSGSEHPASRLKVWVSLLLLLFASAAVAAWILG